MTARALVLLVAVLLVMVSGTPGIAQELTAEVRTWAGQSFRLVDAGLEVFYSILPPSEVQGGQPAAPGGGPAMGAAYGATPQTGRFSGVQLFGGTESLGQYFRGGPEPLQGHRRAESVTLYREGVATRIPVANLATLTFGRQPVTNSTLPPYLAPSDIHYRATAQLTDGTRVEGDYVNLGNALLRGSTPEGRVEIPWKDIEVVRFTR